MADLDDEKAPQHVQPGKPDRRDDPPPAADPNDSDPGRPQHEAHTEYDDQD
jgi:hypothetical protein